MLTQEQVNGILRNIGMAGATYIASYGFAEGVSAELIGGAITAVGLALWGMMAKQETQEMFTSAVRSVFNVAGAVATQRGWISASGLASLSPLVLSGCAAAWSYFEKTSPPKTGA